MKLTNVERFLDAYMETALWASCDEDGTPLDDGGRDFQDDAYAALRLEAAQWYGKMREAIQRAIGTGEVRCGPDFDEWGRAGHDFWLTRNGHGAGFWDGGWPEPYAANLTAIAKEAGEVDLYVGDDGAVHASGRDIAY